MGNSSHLTLYYTLRALRSCLRIPYSVFRVFLAEAPSWIDCEGARGLTSVVPEKKSPFLPCRRWHNQLFFSELGFLRSYGPPEQSFSLATLLITAHAACVQQPT